MNDRREPTISGMRIDPEEVRLRKRAASQGAGKPAQRPTQNRPTAAAPVRSVVVKSKLAPVAFLFALIACGGAAYLYWQLSESQKTLALANQRLIVVEQSLKLTGSESTQSVGAINESLKTHFSEIDKLWAAYRKHKSGISENKKLSQSANKQATSIRAQSATLASELSVISDLVDAQQNALTSVEKSNAAVSSQARSVNEKSAVIARKLAELERKIQNTEKDIEAINGFRRSVNQQLLELRGGAL